VTVGVVLLAAGGSSRLGQPKQLVIHQGQSLVRRAARIAVALDEGPVLVVLGARQEAVSAELGDLPVRRVVNPDWAQGPGGSLRAGLQALLALDGAPPVEALLVMLCDQVRVETAHLRALVDEWRTSGRPVVASGYEGTRGVPALFGREVFEELRALPPEQGARGVIAREPSRVATVPLPLGGEDVDTPQDLLRLR